MKKRRLGISLYPERSTFEQDVAYMEKAAKLGFDVLFIALLGAGDRQQTIDRYKPLLAKAKELGITVDMKYAYGNQFYGDADITAVMDTWYADGTEVVFACGGGIYTSAAEAAAKVGGKLIGVDVDQSANIDTYGEGMCVTSAMKGLYPTTINALTDIIVGGKWADYGGKIETLGLVSGDDPTANYVQLPMETTQWGDGFTQDDYKALVKAMYDGDVTVSNDISAMPATTITVNFAGNIK
mgnify:CR=1 FL=1